MHARAATVPVLLLLERFAGRRREEGRRGSQLPNDPRYTDEATARSNRAAPTESAVPRQRSTLADESWGAVGGSSLARNSAAESVSQAGSGVIEAVVRLADSAIACAATMPPMDKANEGGDEGYANYFSAAQEDSEL